MDILSPNTLLLLIAGLLAGALNAVAGGGTMFTFPALMMTGVPAVAANATSKVGLCPGAFASLFAYRNELKEYAYLLPLLLPISVAGGWLGAELLLVTPKESFEFLVPWLLLLATFLFTFGKNLAHRIALLLGRAAREEGREGSRVVAAIYHLGTSVYGGFFGAGIGILMLSMMEILGLKNIHGMNGLKTALGTAMHFAAVVAFVIGRQVLWSEAAVLIVGSTLGGYYGARLALTLPQEYIRRFVIGVGVSTSAYFFFLD